MRRQDSAYERGYVGRKVIAYTVVGRDGYAVCQGNGVWDNGTIIIWWVVERRVRAGLRKRALRH